MSDPFERSDIGESSLAATERLRAGLDPRAASPSSTP